MKTAIFCSLIMTFALGIAKAGNLDSNGHISVKGYEKNSQGLVTAPFLDHLVEMSSQQPIMSRNSEGATVYLVVTGVDQPAMDPYWPDAHRKYTFYISKNPNLDKDNSETFGIGGRSFEYQVIKINKDSFKLNDANFATSWWIFGDNLKIKLKDGKVTLISTHHWDHDTYWNHH